MYFGLFSLADIMILLPAMLLALYAQYKVKSAYEHYSTVISTSGLTGAQVASNILRNNGIQDVDVERTHGKLSDHYDPRTKTLRLSDEIYREYREVLARDKFKQLDQASVRKLLREVKICADWVKPKISLSAIKADPARAATAFR